MGAAAEGEDCAEATLRVDKKQDVPDPSSAIFEDITVTADVPPQSPLPQPIVGVAITGLSCSSLHAEHTSEHPPHGHGQYDIV